MKRGFPNHPYIPNSVPEIEKEMLEFLGMESLEDLHKNVPDELKFKGEMDIPEAFGSEYELRRYVEELLDRDGDGKKYLNFLGAGCWQHYVPAICDEINSRGEFLTAYGGEPYNELGRFQSQFGGGDVHPHATDHDRHQFPLAELQAEVIHAFHRVPWSDSRRSYRAGGSAAGGRRIVLAVRQGRRS